MKQPEKRTVSIVIPSAVDQEETHIFDVDEQPHGHYIPNEDWNRLGAALGINLKDTADLINHVEAMTHIKVEGVDIRLEPGLIHRLRSRCIRQDFNTFLKDVILKELHAWVGW